MLTYDLEEDISLSRSDTIYVISDAELDSIEQAYEDLISYFTEVPQEN